MVISKIAKILTKYVKEKQNALNNSQSTQSFDPRPNLANFAKFLTNYVKFLTNFVLLINNHSFRKILYHESTSSQLGNRRSTTEEVFYCLSLTSIRSRSSAQDQKIIAIFVKFLTNLPQFD